MPHKQPELPQYVTSFVGREQELARLTALLVPEARNRLVTITGMGGSGKTRLALHAVSLLHPHFADCICLVELASIQQPLQVARAVARAIGLVEGAYGSPEEAILAWLDGRSLLLILDNCEHVIDEVAALAALLLRSAADLHILATSREQLGIAGELHFPLAPLPVPAGPTLNGHPLDDSDLPAVHDMRGETLEALLSFDSIRLFGARAASVRPDFVIDAENIACVVEICRRLDGLPLALELAAVQVRVFTPAELAERIRNRVALLSYNRDAIPRHQTLDNVIEWSYRLLTSEEAALCRRLAFFASGAGLRCIEQICGGDGLPRQRIADLLRRLSDKSLVLSDAQAQGTRYYMLQTVRSYALLQLYAGGVEHGEAAAVRQRHAHCYAQMARDAFSGMRSSESPHWAARLDAEHANLRLAFDYWLQNDPAVGAQMVFHLAWYWAWRWSAVEATQWIQRARRTLLELEEEEGAPAMPLARAHIHYAESVMALWRVQLRTAWEEISAAMEAADGAGAGNDGLRATVAAFYTLVGVYSDHPAQVDAILARFEAGGLAQADKWDLGILLVVRGLAALMRGEEAQAIAHMEQSVRSLRAVGDPFMLAVPLYELGKLQHSRRDFVRAHTLLSECNGLAVRHSLHLLSALSFFRLAETCQGMGQGATALEHCRNAIGVLSRIGDEPGPQHVRFLAGVAADASLWGLCVRLFAAADSTTYQTGTALAPNRLHEERTLERARSALNGAEYARARREGTQLSVADAIALGLAELESALHAGEGPPSPALTLRMLGPSEVCVNGRKLTQTDFKYIRSRDLLFYLVCEGERSRERIGLALWPDANEKQLRERFNVTLHALRQALGSNDWIVFENGLYSFKRAAAYKCDCDDFFDAFRRAESMRTFDPEGAARLLMTATGLVRGEFLADVSHGEWHEHYRGAITGHVLRAFIMLGEIQIELGHWAEALYSLSTAMRMEPFSEEVYRGLMRVHFERRDRVQLIQVYRNLVELLREEYDAPPSDETVALYSSLLARLNGALQAGDRRLA